MIENSRNSEIGDDVNNGQKSRESLYREIDRLVSQHKDELVETRHHLHANPELSNREEKTSALVAKHLRAIGLDEVRTAIAGHGVVGVLHGGLPGDREIALRADTFGRGVTRVPLGRLRWSLAGERIEQQERGRFRSKEVNNALSRTKRGRPS